MSSSPTALPSSFPALAPDIAANIADDLIAAVPPKPDSAPGDRFGHETTLIAELDALHPRDLEETLLAAQMLAAHHAAMRCFQAAAQCEVTSKEASRLLRDGIALQRSLLATLRALHKSQARPVLEDDVDLMPRPTVPVVAPKPARARVADRPAARQPAPRAAGATDTAAPEAANEQSPAAPAPKPRKNPFEGHPDLQALNDRWYDLPPWEQMSMEERRKTFGYTYEPKVPGPSAAPDPSATP